MSSGTWARAGPVLWFVLGLCVGVPGSAAADRPLVVATGPRGVLGTWRVLATTPAAQSPTAPPLVVSSSETIDLDALVPAPPRPRARRHAPRPAPVAPAPPRVVYLGASVEVDAAAGARLYLFAGAAGEVSVCLDGRELAARVAPIFRSDDAVARLDLARGAHRLVIRLRSPTDPEAPWLARIRLLDAHFRPGTPGARFLVGRGSDELERQLLERAARIDEIHEVGPNGLVVRARISFPAGGVAREAHADAGGGERVLAPSATRFSASAEHAYDAPSRGDLRAVARVETRSVRIGRALAADRAVAATVIALRRALARAPDASRAPIAWRIAELERIMSERDDDALWRETLAGDARAIARRIERGEDPFRAPRGYVRMAFFSALDGTAQPYELFVPPAYRAGATGRAWPLVVTLHGFEGNAGDFFRNTFGLSRPPSQSLLEHGRHGDAPREGPMFVVAPTGRGQAMYRYAGEEDVLEALADVRARFRIDPDRIYITGGSMGGTGAAYLPFRYPDLFAASAALAGYHDQRVREDTQHAGLSAWERFLQSERSDTDWAENALHLPMLLVRGTEDLPLAWTRNLATRLHELGYPYEHREPILGHNVWTETYANGAIFEWLGRYRREATPRRVRLRTARERHARAWWVSVGERVAPDAFAEVDACLLPDNRVLARTRGAVAITLAPPGVVRVRAVVDGAAVEGAAPLHLRRERGRWALEPAEARRRRETAGKRRGVSGPIRDVYDEPLVFVIGTRDRDHLLINELVAEQWSRPTGWRVHYPVVRDVDVTEEMKRTKTLVLIGPPRSNALTAQASSRLPIRIERDAIVVGARRYGGPEVGTVLVAPSPFAPSRAILVIAGVTPLGTWRSLFLPDLLPDYVVFDASIAPARDRWAGGGTGAHYRDAGFFSTNWTLRH